MLLTINSDREFSCRERLLLIDMNKPMHNLSSNEPNLTISQLYMDLTTIEHHRMSRMTIVSHIFLIYLAAKIFFGVLGFWGFGVLGGNDIAVLA